ncbi:MAG: tetratricopeptide repeat protein [Planctomycetota bacterium]|jgi:hypothetical protein
MFFKKNWAREPRVTTVLRAMERGRFADAMKALRRKEEDGPLVPPHALWRLGRWCLEKKQPKDACVPLELFLGLYPGHQDRPQVLRDLARAMAQSGRHKQAAALGEQAQSGQKRRTEKLRDQRFRNLLLSGRKQVAGS